MTQGVLSKDTLFCPGGFGLTGGGNDGSPVEDSAPEFPVGRQGGIQPLPKARIAFQHGHIVDGIGQGFRRTDQHADLFGARDTRIDQVAKRVISTGMTTIGYSDPWALWIVVA